MTAPGRVARRPGELGDFTADPADAADHRVGGPDRRLGRGGGVSAAEADRSDHQRWSSINDATALVAPGAGHHPWWLCCWPRSSGGLVIGLMARFGSEKIRGHGMPEAIEAILHRRQPDLAEGGAC